MNVQEIKESIQEAEKFINRAKIAMKDLENDKFAKYSNSNVAAMRRTSMDLTKLLVKIRKPYS